MQGIGIAPSFLCAVKPAEMLAALNAHRISLIMSDTQSMTPSQRRIEESSKQAW